MNPVSIDHVFGLLVLVPIVCCGTITFNEQIANISLGDSMAAFVGNQCLITRHKLARAAWLYPSYPITDENVQDLSAANAIEDLYIEGFLEATKDIGRQGFTGGDADTHGGEIEAFSCIGQSQHTGIERRNAIEDRWTILFNDFEHIFRHQTPREMDGAGTHSEGEVQVIAQAIGKVELGRGEGNVILLDAKDRFGIILGTVGHIVLQVDTTFGEACAAGAIQPESTIILARLRCFQVCRCFLRPFVKVMHSWSPGVCEPPRLSCLSPRQGSRERCPYIFLFRSYDDDVPQVFELRQDLFHLLPQRRVDNQGTRTAVIEHIHVVVGAQHSVDRHRYSSYFDGTKEGRGKLGGVEQQEGHALLQVDAKVEQPIPDAIGQFCYLRVGIGRSFVINSGLCAAPLCEVTIQKSAGGIELIRYDDRRYSTGTHEHTSFLWA